MHVPRNGVRLVAGSMFALLLLAGCGDRGDVAEQHRRLSLQLRHVPIRQAPENQDVEFHARIHSSLEGPKLEGWVRILGEDDLESRVQLTIDKAGDAKATVPGKPRGQELRYVIEVRDAAEMIVSLPKNAAEGDSYTVLFVGRSNRLLGGISYFSAILATLLFVGAGLTAVHCLRGRMSAGPAGMLGGLGSAVVILGLLGLGAIHAYQITGRPWPDAPVFFQISRLDLGLVTLLWIANLAIGRRALLDQEPDGSGERTFAIVALAGAVLTLLFLIF